MCVPLTLLSAATSAIDETAVCMAEIANRIGQLETTTVTERAARFCAEQHVQTLTTQLQTLSRKPDSQTHAQLVGLIDPKEWEKPKLDASTNGAWTDWVWSCWFTPASWVVT